MEKIQKEIEAIGERLRDNRKLLRRIEKDVREQQTSQSAEPLKQKSDSLVRKSKR